MRKPWILSSPLILLFVGFVLPYTLCGNSIGQVKTGLDVLEGKSWKPLRGKRVGVITNQTGIDGQSRHIADLLHSAPKVKLVALFGPEHGIRGDAEAGEEIVTGVDPKTGLPVFSLYGETHKPTPEMLRGIDVLVFDIQDVGARFYTYISTLSLAMEAAAETGIEFVVLDRPNPITGSIVEGPVLKKELASFVGPHPIPLRHGMTVGELAELFNSEGYLANGVRAKLSVIKMENWQRGMWFEQTGLPWVKPSPNITSPTTAMLYPGIGLLEATNFSEGRGTSLPFENVGASWADSQKLIEALRAYQLPGIAFHPATFTPVDLPGVAMNPKFEGQACHGLFLRITDPDTFRPVTFAIHLLSILKRLYPHEFTIRERGMNLMTGTETVYQAIEKGEEPAEIIASWHPDLATFMALRQKYLLYK